MKDEDLILEIIKLRLYGMYEQLGIEGTEQAIKKVDNKQYQKQMLVVHNELIKNKEI